MATSVFLAKLIGPVLLVAAIGLFINTSGYRAMAQEFLRGPALLYLAGILTMTAGLAIVLNHNVWVANWPVLITILGWLAVIGGAVRMALPDVTRKLGDSMLRNDRTLQIGGAVWLAIGAILTFFGYFRGLVR
jgi:uncharacterized protein YjeT (DUF2065 family)